MYMIFGYLGQYISNPKVIIAFSLLIALLSSYQYIPKVVFWALLTIYIVTGFCFLIYWLYNRKKNQLNRTNPEETPDESLDSDKKDNNKENIKVELKNIAQQLKTALAFIKKSKLGNQKGQAALYQLPWYMLIGSPAAGKSSAIYHSGLKFIFKDPHQSIPPAEFAETQQCDWFFSTEGVLLDTAGRYAVYADAQPEWLGFLKLLKKTRNKAPINGLIVIVNVAELISQSPEKTLKLANSLRSRIQDIIERLEISTPVYVVFSKMDLIAGFTSFFQCFQGNELDQVWGASLPYNASTTQNLDELFEHHYHILYDGLRHASTTHLSRCHANNISPNILTFPLEFKSLKPVLKLFINNLFEENPYQFKPVFRGFYFTSALQQGVVESPMTASIAQEYGLKTSTSHDKQLTPHNIKNQRYFLKNLFSNVILKDKDLVQQHINPQNKRRRNIGFLLLFFIVSIVLALWIWSYRNNQQLIIDVQADLNKVVQMESTQGQSLLTHLDALLILQQRLQQLDDFERNKPLKFSFGLYQGRQLRERLKIEYLNGIKKIILLPTQQNMAEYLQQVNNNAGGLKNNQNKVQVKSNTVEIAKPYFEPSDHNPQDAYNALKAYIMLGNKQYAEEGHLRDQVTRFWRLWLNTNYPEQDTAAELTQKTEQILTYATQLVTDKSFPVLQTDPKLVEQSRQLLISVVQGMPAKERVYNEIKMRAAMRFPTLTITQIIGETHKNTILGGYALSGVFSQKAWSEYVSKAIDNAANTPTDSKDWVLNISQSDDLSFSGSPDQIRQQLTQLYKQEYIREWQKFLAAIHYPKSRNFIEEIKLINVLADPTNSPIRILIERIAKETSWDNPAIQAELATPQTGFVAWFKLKILRQEESIKTPNNFPQTTGQISQAFNVFYQLVRRRDDQQNQSLLDEYLQNFSQLRSQFNQLKTSGDMGPNTLALVKATINEQKSVFNTVQKNVDEKLSTGLHSTDQQIIQKLFLSPVTQAFDALLVPAQDELNKLWLTQAYQPFNQVLATKYPFNSAATVQATSTEIAQIMGESGSISRYVKDNLDPLIIRRGYSLTTKTWQNLGIHLTPEFIADFKSYVAPINGIATGELNQSKNTVSGQSNFQFFPLLNQALRSYTIEIDGQRLVFDNTVQQWVSFIWPNPRAIPGAKITVVDLEGNTHIIFEAPGEYGINQLIDSAQRVQKNGMYEMTWNTKKNPQLFVKTVFRLISGSEAGGNRGYTHLKLVNRVVNITGTQVVAAQMIPPQGGTTGASENMTKK